MRIRHIVIRGLSGSTAFFQIISQTAQFSKNSLFGVSLQRLFETLLIIRRNEEDMVKNEEDVVKNEEDMVKNEEDMVKNEEDMVKNEEDMVKNEYWYSCKVPIILVRF
jgi:hypothetical protein